MHKHSKPWFIALGLASGLLGCGEAQRYYRVAIDETPLRSLPTTCYRTAPTPTDPSDRTDNMVDVEQWIVWDGVEGQRYLQVGHVGYAVGEAYGVAINGDAILSVAEADKPTFIAERILSSGGSTPRVITTRATYTFDSLGDTVQGSLVLSSVCTGSTCDRPNCEASLRFSGRILDADPMLVVGDSPRD
jgi:hypothetical protein